MPPSIPAISPSTCRCQATFVNWQRTGVLSVCHQEKGVYQKTRLHGTPHKSRNKSNSTSLTGPKMIRLAGGRDVSGEPAVLHTRMECGTKMLEGRAYTFAPVMVSRATRGVLDGARDLLRLRARCYGTRRTSRRYITADGRHCSRGVVEDCCSVED